VEIDRHLPDSKPFIYAGNALGEVYIYQVTNIDEAFTLDDDSQMP
jgi:hypothetical protein